MRSRLTGNLVAGTAVVFDGSIAADAMGDSILVLERLPGLCFKGETTAVVILFESSVVSAPFIAMFDSSFASSVVKVIVSRFFRVNGGLCRPTSSTLCTIFSVFSLLRLDLSRVDFFSIPISSSFGSTC